nr:immunoglobulin light chain junction region [Macaca mulatta]MOV98370.1 immunoglobulin light chain junction region [Macaca mulatta]MOW01275.1 immunoglobulin light chain junction region [Macaca mulatta]MOW01715.1 immunoglobulin light chain junction region [Macaca mulatta]
DYYCLIWHNNAVLF